MVIILVFDYIILKFSQHIKYDMVTFHVYEKVCSFSAVVGRKDCHIKKSLCNWVSVSQHQLKQCCVLPFFYSLLLCITCGDKL